MPPMRLDLRSLWHADTRLLELFAALVALWWAAILLLFNATFAAAPSYAILHALVPDGLSGLWFGTQGGLQAWAVVARWDSLREIVAMVAAGVWMTVAMVLLMVHPPLPAAGIYLGLAGVCAWIVARGPHDAD